MVEAFLLSNGIVEATDQEADTPTNQACEGEVQEAPIKFKVMENMDDSYD